MAKTGRLRRAYLPGTGTTTPCVWRHSGSAIADLRDRLAAIRAHQPAETGGGMTQRRIRP